MTEKGVDDAVLIVESRAMEEPDWWAFRTVVVALNVGAGFDAIAVAPCVLGIDGMWGVNDAGPALRIRRGVLVLEEGGGGGSTRSLSTRRFRYDRATHAVLLIGEDEMTIDSSTEEETRHSTNHLTHMREERSACRERNGRYRRTTRILRVPIAPLRRIEGLPHEEP